jgi:hypothetical protein
MTRNDPSFDNLVDYALGIGKYARKPKKKKTVKLLDSSHNNEVTAEVDQKSTKTGISK